MGRIDASVTGGGSVDLDGLTAVVPPAVAAHDVGQLGGLAPGADAARRGGQGPGRCPATAALRLGGLLLRDGHKGGKPSEPEGYWSNSSPSSAAHRGSLA